jgi:hypothetical protein
MKGAIAELSAKIISAPKKSKVRMMGRSQYFFLALIKPHKSRKKSISSDLLSKTTVLVCSLAKESIGFIDI